MARELVIPPKTTLAVPMPPALLRALLISKAALQDKHFDAAGSTNPDVGRDWIVADGLRAVNLVLGYPNDHVVTRARLLKQAEKA